MKKENKITLIRVHESTRERLNSIGKKGETYEDIILNALNAAEKILK